MSKVGRNAPCPCGSGRKYKQCCLKQLELDRYTAADRAAAHERLQAVLEGPFARVLAEQEQVFRPIAFDRARLRETSIAVLEGDGPDERPSAHP